MSFSNTSNEIDYIKGETHSAPNVYLSTSNTTAYNETVEERKTLYFIELRRSNNTTLGNEAG
jgi:hypothetical protein